VEQLALAIRLVVLGRLRVDLGHDERHVRVEPEVAAVVYDDGAPGDGLAGELDRRTLLALGAREEGDVHTLERLGLRHPDVELFAGKRRRPGAAGQDT